MVPDAEPVVLEVRGTAPDEAAIARALAVRGVVVGDGRVRAVVSCDSFACDVTIERPHAMTMGVQPSAELAVVWRP